MADQTEGATPKVQLTPIQLPPGHVLGKYASFPVSTEPMFGPDEMGEYKSGIEDMDETVTRAETSARLWEVLQSWEARLFSRGYQFLQGGRRGWGMYGAVNGAQASGAEIMQSQNSGKLFPVNVYAAREDKIVAALSREVPGLTFVPKQDSSPMDQTAADEKKKYLKVWMTEAEIAEVVGQVAQFLYTDGCAILYTGSWADQQAWGTETPNKPQVAFGAAEPDGVTPETEMQGGSGDNGNDAGNSADGAAADPEGLTEARSGTSQEELPAIREVTKAGGKLEWKRPIYCDKQAQFPWIRGNWEENVNTLKERYVWIEDKIKAGSSDGKDQLDRLARINVRLAVQTSSSSGESWQQDATESFTWYRPSQYRSIKNKDIRQVYFDNFPDGCLVIHAGGELALIRNESMDKHLTVIHAKHGSGQNRRAIGSNYLPLQKILNANISLLDRYIRACIPRKYHDTDAINSEAINGQNQDPSKSTPVLLKAGQSIDTITGVEKVPQPTNVSFEFIQWLIDGAPEAMDGASPAMFGMEDADTFGATKLNRDSALQVFSMPWRRMCFGLAKAAEQAAECAAQNRQANIAFNVPGQDKLEIELSKLQGDALCYPESLEIPQTIAEQEAQMAELLENGKNVAIYQAIAQDPRNLVEFGKFPSLANLEIPGLDAVEQQQGEFELLMQNGPIDNPQTVQLIAQLQQLTQQIEAGQTHPEAQTPQGQQTMQALQQAAQQLQQQIQTLGGPKISSVPVAQDGSENHQIHAAITLGFMTSPAGRKLKNGDDEQKAIFQNFTLHWQEHVEMGEKLTPPKEIEFKGSLSVDPSKFSPEVQSKIFQSAGLQVSPEEAQNDQSLVPHETKVEREGVDAQGVPTKQVISMVGKGLR